MNDRHNRPMLVFSLGIYALLMGLMALASYGRPIDGALGVLLAFLIWPMIFAAVIGGMAWLADAPLLRRLYDDDSGPRQLLGAVLFLAGITAIAFGAIAAWCVESAWSYLGFAVLCGAMAAHQYAILEDENRPPEALPLPSVRQVR